MQVEMTASREVSDEHGRIGKFDSFVANRSVDNSSKPLAAKENAAPQGPALVLPLIGWFEPGLRSRVRFGEVR